MRLFILLLTLLLPYSPIKADPLPSKEPFLLFYSPYFLELLQIMYGADGVISQGGIDSIDDLFSGIELDQKKVLDLGCGLGQVDIYLAKKYDVQISGVDCASYLIDQANNRLQKSLPELKGQVTFSLLEKINSLKEFANNSFDLVFSKEVFYHVPEKIKQEYLHEIYRVLKPGGIILIADWGKKDFSLALQRAIRTENCCFLVTPKKFLEQMSVAGFGNLDSRDVTVKHIQYSQRDLQRIHDSKDLLTHLDPGAYEHALKSCQLWLDAIESGDLLSQIFFGKKEY